MNHKKLRHVAQGQTCRISKIHAENEQRIHNLGLKPGTTIEVIENKQNTPVTIRFWGGIRALWDEADSITVVVR